MIIRCDELQKICSKILLAVDINSVSTLTETLEMYTEDNFLYLAVTNREYFVKIQLDIQKEVEFNATVSAELFLKLISKMTTETVEFTVDDSSLIIKGNGNYKLPMIYEGDELLKLPKIDISNVTTSFNIDTSILNNIYNYNSKELAKKHVIANPVQTMYYIDEKGCITFTTGACVNKFTLPEPIKILLSDKIVKLFKLFKEDSVEVYLGQDYNGGVIQTKLKLLSDSVELTTIINSDDSLINSVPENVIRNMAFDIYPYSIVINKNIMLDAIDRILLFSKNVLVSYGKFEFSKDKLVINSINDDTVETIFYDNEIVNDTTYSTIFDLNDLKLTLKSIKSDYVTMNFGNERSAVLIEKNIYNIIPECIL